MKVQWNDKILDTDNARANNDGSFTWQYPYSWLTYFPDKELMVCIDKCLIEQALPVLYKKQTK